MSQEPTAEEVLGALERTVRRGSARIEFRFSISLADAFSSEHRSMCSQGCSGWPRVKRLVGSVVTRMFDWGMFRVLKRLSNTMAEGVVGIIDFEGSRCVYFLGRSKAEMIVGDQRWCGAPGAIVEGPCPGPASELQPLWLVDLVRGVVDAQEQAAEHLNGHLARRFLAHADLNRAADAVSYAMATPSDIHQRVDLTRIAVELWIDDNGYIRRIRQASAETPMSTSTLDLIEFGVTLPSDWSRIPSVPTDQNWVVDGAL